LLSVLVIYFNNILANLSQVYKEIKEYETKIYPKGLEIRSITPENILGLRKAQNNLDDAIRKLNKKASLLTSFKGYRIATDNLERENDIYKYLKDFASLLRDVKMMNKYLISLKEVAMKI